MRTEIELTPKEAALIAKIIGEGHTLRSITKSENKFDVGYKYRGGNSWGGEGIVYNLPGSWNEGVENIRRLETTLQTIQDRNADDEDSSCPHDENDHGYCLDCGKDIHEDLEGRADDLRDSNL
jgi:hypothetical protein